MMYITSKDFEKDSTTKYRSYGTKHTSDIDLSKDKYKTRMLAKERKISDKERCVKFSHQSYVRYVLPASYVVLSRSTA